ncbi:hypothetical protein QN277_025640 [Acacia crassicarpa]|uniref:Uncharacterized protein n=1 Tax=Acacia crassicarpa TaxID=499986 RepID=A0AAE1K357_9FABA|nr:hypothetical protein QN277_025640 [Acacia crassicarpa]
MSNTSKPTLIYKASPSKYHVVSQGYTIEATITRRASVVDKWLLQVYSKYGGRHTVVGLDTDRVDASQILADNESSNPAAMCGEHVPDPATMSPR